MAITTSQFPYTTSAIRIEQPLGEFFAVAIPAAILLSVTYSNPLRLAGTSAKPPWYRLFGTQRSAEESRFKEISNYIQSIEAAFPNSIIIGANYTKDGVYIGDPDSEHHKAAWKLKKRGDLLQLSIPTNAPVASVIDGQHRLGGFAQSGIGDRINMPLLCAVYLDLPFPYHAYLFATINFNQKKVDKSSCHMKHDKCADPGKK